METRSIQILMFVVVQLSDVDNVESALSAAGLFFTRLSSFGGFLKRKNVTLLVGLSNNQVDQVFNIIKQNCIQRVEYITPPLESSPLSISLSTPVTVGGATILTLDVERYEEIG